MQSNISMNSRNVIITNNFIIGALVKDALEQPTIAFQSISNSYTVLREIERTHIKNITFVLSKQNSNENLEYIINRIFRDLIPLGYNLNVKYVEHVEDIFEENFNVYYNTLNKAS